MKTRIRILHIDDNLHDRQIVQEALQNEQDEFEITDKDSHLEFELLLSKNDYDLILSELKTSGFEGLNVLQIVKEKKPEIPLIIVTGSGSEEIATKALKSGAVDYVKKSGIHIQNLSQTIRKAIENRKTQSEHNATQGHIDGLPDRYEIQYRIFYLTTILFLLFTFTTLHAQDLKKEINFSQKNFLPFYNLRKTGNTSIFQGNTKNKKYFEGWYFKMVAEDGASILSVIPGISLSSDGKKQHAFVQIIDGVAAQTNYYSFPIEDFSFSKKEFAIKIGDNYFSKDLIILNLKDNESIVSGTINMYNSVDYTSGKLLNPGIMGWYRFVPFMQCYHGVVSLTNKLNGKLIVNNEIYDFTNGKGYIEKDWGASMPSAWIWLQSNHFNDSNTSIMLSIADIPWLGKSFTGFLGFFYHNNQIHHFATYSRTKLKLEIDESDLLNIEIKNKKNTFILNAKSNNTAMLKAPAKGSMDRRIPESIDATLIITMLDRKGSIVFIDSTNITGLEMVGDYKNLQGLLK